MAQDLKVIIHFAILRLSYYYFFSINTFFQTPAGKTKKDSEQLVSKVVLETSERDAHKIYAVNMTSTPQSSLKLEVEKEGDTEKDALIFETSTPSIKLDSDIHKDVNIVKSTENYKGLLLEYLQKKYRKTCSPTFIIKSNEDGSFTSTINLEDGFTMTGSKGYFTSSFLFFLSINFYSNTCRQNKERIRAVGFKSCFRSMQRARRMQ